MTLTKFADFRILGHITKTSFPSSGRVATITIESPHRYLDGEVVRETIKTYRCTTFDRKLIDKLKAGYGKGDFVSVGSDELLPAKSDGKGGFYQAAFKIATIEMKRKAKPQPKVDALAGLSHDD